MTAPKLLVIDNLDPRTMLYALLPEVVTDGTYQIEECHDEDCYEHLEKKNEYSALLVNTSRQDAVALVETFHKHNQAFVIFVAADHKHALFAEKLASLSALGNNWALAQRNSADIGRALLLALRSAAQQRRFRTKLHE